MLVELVHSPLPFPMLGESSGSTPERVDPQPDREHPFQHGIKKRTEFDRLRGLRLQPVDFLPHEGPHMRALAAAGLEIEEGNPGANAPPAQLPLGDEPQEDQHASSVAFFVYLARVTSACAGEECLCSSTGICVAGVE